MNNLAFDYNCGGDTSNPHKSQSSDPEGVGH